MKYIFLITGSKDDKVSQKIDFDTYDGDWKRCRERSISLIVFGMSRIIIF